MNTCINSCGQLKTNTLTHFVHLLLLTCIIIISYANACTDAKRKQSPHTLSHTHTCMHDSFSVCSYVQNVDTHTHRYIYTVTDCCTCCCCCHMLSLSVSHTHSQGMKTDLPLSNTFACVRSQSLFPWKPQGQGVNERLCGCVTIRKMFTCTCEYTLSTYFLHSYCLEAVVNQLNPYLRRL